ncbi:MAG: osmotically inducible protein OsmC [Desulfovibrionaceae bacterium CG1_02_65_16]|nr:MAG: osmotically inducible protein OsmC [Desulfovibrionaceae bacterium CG1_02_65_16]
MPTVTFERLDENRDLFRVGAKAVPEIIMDFSKLTPEERGQEHMGARLLCVAALSCYTGTFVNALQRHGAQVKSMTASATLSKEKDEVNRTRYTTLDISVEVGLEEKNRTIFETVKDSMLNGSLLTYSLEEGMAVSYDLKMNAV